MYFNKATVHYTVYMQTKMCLMFTVEAHNMPTDKQEEENYGVRGSFFYDVLKSYVQP